MQLNFQIWSARRGVIRGKGAQIVKASLILKSSMKSHALPCYRKSTPDEILPGRTCNRHIKGQTNNNLGLYRRGFLVSAFKSYTLC